MDKMNKRDLLFLVIGILIGLVGAYCFIIGFISTFDGIIQNVNVTIALNESRLVEEMNKTIIQNRLT
jgi:hypothetical protein